MGRAGDSWAAFQAHCKAAKAAAAADDNAALSTPVRNCEDTCTAEVTAAPSILPSEEVNEYALADEKWRAEIARKEAKRKRQGSVEDGNIDFQNPEKCIKLLGELQEENEQLKVENEELKREIKELKSRNLE